MTWWSWKTQHENFMKFSSQIDQAEERITEIEDQLNEIKWEGKNRDKNEKNETSKKYGIMWKDIIYVS